jgi:hypothetical protein
MSPLSIILSTRFNLIRNVRLERHEDILKDESEWYKRVLRRKHFMFRSAWRLQPKNNHLKFLRE